MAQPTPKLDQRPLTTTPPALAAPDLPPLKTRRRPLLVVLAVVLVALGSLLAAFLMTLNQTTISVVAAKQPLTRGDVITADVLDVVEVPPNSMLRTIPAADLQQLVGKRAATDIQNGGIVTPDAVTEQPYPGDGRAVVGMALKPGQLPTVRSLQGGDKVLVVYTPRSGDDIVDDGAPARQVPAEVVGIRAIADTSDVIVDVSVATNQAPALADIVATQRIAVILQGA